MKLTSSFVVLAGTLAVLAIPTLASSGTDNLAVRNLHFDPIASSPADVVVRDVDYDDSAEDDIVYDNEELAARDVDLEERATCGVGHRKHHRKNSNNNKTIQSASVQSVQQKKKVSQKKKKVAKKISSARPVHYQTPSSSQRKAMYGSYTTTSSAKPATSTTPSTSGLSDFASTILRIHNEDRAQHSAAPLTWDATLASAAQSWANGCKWQHTPNNPYGQNIAAGTSPTFGAVDATTLWYNEYKLYDYSAGQYSDSTGHFTQMVWKGSKRLGCAIQTCTASQMGLGSTGSARYVVCNYDPPGNYIGEFKQNVSPN